MDINGIGLRRLCVLLLLPLFSGAQQAVWSTQKAEKWYNEHRWVVGANYIPHNAVNQLEMWQRETFSPQLIDTELALAQSIGFNTVRVFLHSVAWNEDAKGFKERINTFLAIADRHGIQPIFVFFDDCWNKRPVAGKQPDPRPGVHNSGWVQDPGQPMSGDTLLFPSLKKYVTDILRTFGKDTRILAWDLYNEPGNSGKGEKSLPLLEAVFSWARQAGPSQPLTAGLWDWKLEKLNAFQATHSDIISYHDYEDETFHLRTVQLLKSFGRPLICTEYMARTQKSLFSNILPMLKKEQVGAINWGFVSGKTNTIYAWDTPLSCGEEPKVWFHDIFRPDYRPYRVEEVRLIKYLTTGK